MFSLRFALFHLADLWLFRERSALCCFGVALGDGVKRWYKARKDMPDVGSGIRGVLSSAIHDMITYADICGEGVELDSDLSTISTMRCLGGELAFGSITTENDPELRLGS